jgi:hypothetical protein
VAAKNNHLPNFTAENELALPGSAQGDASSDGWTIAYKDSSLCHPDLLRFWGSTRK